MRFNTRLKFGFAFHILIAAALLVGLILIELGKVKVGGRRGGPSRYPNTQDRIIFAVIIGIIFCAATRGAFWYYRALKRDSRRL